MHPIVKKKNLQFISHKTCATVGTIEIPKVLLNYKRYKVIDISILFY